MCRSLFGAASAQSSALRQIRTGDAAMTSRHSNGVESELENELIWNYRNYFMCAQVRSPHLHA